MPFIRIGGNVTFPPPLLARLQTDGSYRARVGRTSVILHTSAGNAIYKHTVTMPFALNSTETEWASVLSGLEFAQDKNEAAIGIENDNLGVIQALIHPGTTLKHEYARFYRQKIQKIANSSVWTGVRWIPLAQNTADALLR